jgi:signal transduction histidine kinase
MLVDLNKEIFDYRIEMLQLMHSDSATMLLEKTKYHASLQKRWTMVFGEGAVFLSLLMYGIYRTRTAFVKEFALARQQKNFLLSITHEFKSPLAAVKLNLQTLQKRFLEPTQKEEVIRKALVETDRIHFLIENALLASRLESHNYEIYFEEMDFSQFVKDVVSDFKDRYEHEHIIETDIESGLWLRGDNMALTSLVNNLVENAEKYSPPSTTIHISLKKLDNEIVLKVADEGNGIPDKEKQKVFNKFYRLGNEETRKTKGTGLGLFIVRHVALLHKATINLYDNNPIGATFEVRFNSKK